MALSLSPMFQAKALLLADISSHVDRSAVVQSKNTIGFPENYRRDIFCFLELEKNKNIH